jgi:hypothetical protein
MWRFKIGDGLTTELINSVATLFMRINDQHWALVRTVIVDYSSKILLGRGANAPTVETSSKGE